MVNGIANKFEKISNGGATTSYEKSFNQFVNFLNDTETKHTMDSDTVLKFLVACKAGWPNNTPKELKALLTKYKGILYTCQKRNLGDLPSIEEMSVLIENSESKILPIKSKLRSQTA